ncbi:two-component system, HptB-dependent secretion and biofilm response regulator [Gammaproteobacteria bacterium]
MKILIVDDNRLNVVTTSTYCRTWGHSVVTAMDGAQAVERYQAERPDLILMDVMMPVMNGFDATARIRTLAEPHWVPIILLTALGSEDDLVRGIASGADDYLTKPVNFTILREKIRVMERIATIQGQLTESLAGLQDYRDKAEEERHLAAHVMDRIVGFGQENDELVSYRIIPALNFSGDLVASARTPAGDLHVALADATGHGLAAALNVMPMIEVFYGMTEKGFPISRIAVEMNRKIRRLMPRERFVAAILVSVEFSSNTLSVWNGGCPAALFVNEMGEVLRTFSSVHPPLGILVDTAFSPALEVYQWPVPGQLLMCSDGLLEAEDPQGTPFGPAGLTRILQETLPHDRLDHIITALHQHLGGAPQIDDVSLMALECRDTCPLVAEAPTHPSHVIQDTGQWYLGVRLGHKEVRGIDVLPFLLDWCRQAGLSEHHLSNFFIIVAELYNNAVDHGLLGLDSRIKVEPDGFERYIRLRAERLEALDDGRITIDLSIVKERSPMLRVHVVDSGPGFDYAAYGRTIENDHIPFGRGIVLVRHLCQKVEFRGRGNDVVVYYPLTESLPDATTADGEVQEADTP